MRQTAMNTSTITKKTLTHGNRIESESKLKTNAILCIACVTSVKYAVDERVCFAF